MWRSEEEKMNHRKLAMAIIAADVAETGKAGKAAIRAYVETRLSMANFRIACAAGQAIYQRKIAQQVAP